MNDVAWLLCDVLSENNKNDTILVKSELDDGTEFRVEVSKYILTKIEKVAGRPAWLEVIQSGSHDGRASVTLPNAVLNLGSKVTVSSKRLRSTNPVYGSREEDIRLLMSNLKVPKK